MILIKSRTVALSSGRWTHSTSIDASHEFDRISSNCGSLLVQRTRAVRREPEILQGQAELMAVAHAGRATSRLAILLDLDNKDPQDQGDEDHEGQQIPAAKTAAGVTHGGLDHRFGHCSTRQAADRFRVERGAAGRVGTSSRSRTYSNRSSGLVPKKRSAAVVPSGR